MGSPGPNKGIKERTGDAVTGPNILKRKVRITPKSKHYSYRILRGETSEQDNTEMVECLLSLGEALEYSKGDKRKLRTVCQSLQRFTAKAFQSPFLRCLLLLVVSETLQLLSVVSSSVPLPRNIGWAIWERGV